MNRRQLCLCSTKPNFIRWARTHLITPLVRLVHVKHSESSWERHGSVPPTWRASPKTTNVIHIIWLINRDVSCRSLLTPQCFLYRNIWWKTILLCSWILKLPAWKVADVCLCEALRWTGDLRPGRYTPASRALHTRVQGATHLRPGRYTPTILTYLLPVEYLF